MSVTKNSTMTFYYSDPYLREVSNIKMPKGKKTF